MQAQHPVHARGGEALRQGETGAPRPLAPPHGGTDGAEAHDHQRPCRGLGDGGIHIICAWKRVLCSDIDMVDRDVARNRFERDIVLSIKINEPKSTR